MSPTETAECCHCCRCCFPFTTCATSFTSTTCSPEAGSPKAAWRRTASLPPSDPIGSIEPIDSPDRFRIGEHGIILEKGPYRSVYLPEVAVEQGWSREETLASLCQKAGLGPDAWREGARFKVFSSVALSRD